MGNAMPIAAPGPPQVRPREFQHSKAFAVVTTGPMSINKRPVMIKPSKIVVDDDISMSIPTKTLTQMRKSRSDVKMSIIPKFWKGKNNIDKAEVKQIKFNFNPDTTTNKFNFDESVNNTFQGGHGLNNGFNGGGVNDGNGRGHGDTNFFENPEYDGPNPNSHNMSWK